MNHKSLTPIVSAVATALIAGPTLAADITLNGASQFGDEHAFTKALQRFADLVQECYSGEVVFNLYNRNSGRELFRQSWK